MARPLGKLSVKACDSGNLKTGRHSDGGGLYLNVAPGGSKSWVFIWVRAGRKTEIGLGPYPAVGLARAREIAAASRAEVASGRDPKALRAAGIEPTFGECVGKFLDAMESGWRNEKHRAQWRSTLETYCADMWSLRVSSIGTDDVLRSIRPIWSTKPETATRVRGRIERVLNFARANGWRQEANPAIWRGHLKDLLPAPGKLTRGHHAAMPYAEVPAFVRSLRELAAMSARGLEVLILTAARSGEILGAQWDEVDLDAAVWTVPAARMKAGKMHRVPLSDRAVEILQQLSETRTSAFVFPGERKGRPLSSMAFTMLMRRQKVGHYTPHGFRSAFRDWCGDTTEFPREVAEAALAHEVGNKVEAAYRRSDALAKRRQLMDHWAEYCASG
jgi:integrase